ncbi:uncharacterized protein PHACADRAFT_189422 [Phanerochaete carnosa HHB-10118-sp]|uniref:Uncharacterized protein n=1 Tax=Phanerochaete carnosa (strain HHB-10118-sp) TaxID=650164 RepID=K5W8Q1_PHACS|nr:uncharacterized protein PHACADRAFT_189422 [Phanerochaete carnosa HHB-10118-sp]EKM60288.1 hypothetical protein PHACADRAFT_189422 [Phanerochaete carnosa HHB-10118-sp]
MLICAQSIYAKLQATTLSLRPSTKLDKTLRYRNCQYPVAGRKRADTQGGAIATVDPTKLTSDCYRDFSGLKTFCLHLREGADSSSRSTRWQRQFLCLTTNGSKIYAPSPPGTHGFFYYRTPPPWAHDLAGEIRFRITKDSDPSTFASGYDLLVKGMPWAVTLLFNSSISAGFRNAVLHDGLLSEDQIHRMERLEPWRCKLTAKSRLLHSIGQPFALPISTDSKVRKSSLYFVPGITDDKDVLENLHIVSHSGYQWGYNTGTDGVKTFSRDAIAIVHLEPWIHPHDRKRRCVVIRVRKLLHCDGLPVKSLDDHPDYGVAGHLLHSVGPVKEKVWYHKIHQGPIAWRHLCLPPEGVTMDL